MPRQSAGPGRRIVTSGRQVQPTAISVHHPQIAALILDDGTVRRILGNDALIAAMPILSSYAAKYKAKQGTKTSGCGGCGGSSSSTVVGDIEYNAVRYHIVNAGLEKQELIKKALNVKQLRVYYLDSGGNRARATV